MLVKGLVSRSGARKFTDLARPGKNKKESERTRGNEVLVKQSFPKELLHNKTNFSSFKS